MTKLARRFIILTVSFLVVLSLSAIYLMSKKSPKVEVVGISTYATTTSSTSPPPTFPTTTTVKISTQSSSKPPSTQAQSAYPKDFNPWKTMIVKSKPLQMVTPYADVQFPKPPYPPGFQLEPHRDKRVMKRVRTLGANGQVLYPIIRDQEVMDFDDVIFDSEENVTVAATEEDSVKDVLKAQETYRKILRHYKDQLHRPV